VSSPFKDHVSPLNQPFVNKFIAIFSRLSRLAASSEEYSALFIFYAHEVGRYFDVHHIGTIAVGLEIVHEQIMSVVDEEMKGVHHFSVVAD
jgi:hypothetical protein